MSKPVYVLCLAAIVYVYFAYFFVLRLASSLRSLRETRNFGYVPYVSVIVCAYNEEETVKERIENLLNSEYPSNGLEIIVTSDGSTDKTVLVASQDTTVRILDFKSKRGRASSQNDSVKEAKGEVIVFTDSETVFEKKFFKAIVSYFSDDRVGCVVGNLIYKTCGSPISESESFYWKYEKKIREVESKIGILATGTGACMAVRRELWRTLSPTDDSDFITPLDVILQGYKVVYAPDAIAYDNPPSTLVGEFRTRVRQTSKNIVGTLRRWGWKGVLYHPLVTWGLFSHKILRWLTPFFMAGVFVSNLFLLDKGLVYQIIFLVQVAFYSAGFLGLVAEIFRKRLPVASSILSFCVANMGMAIGVIKGLTGRAPASYKNE